MKLDTTKDITVTSSKAGADYLDLKMTGEDGKPITITALVGTMAGIGIVLTKVTGHLIAQKTGAVMKLRNIKPTVNLN